MMSMRQLLTVLVGSLLAGGLGLAPAFSAPAAGSSEPTLLGQFGAWGAYTASPNGKKVCFALAKPSSPKPNPPNRPRDPAYAFISSRPAEKVINGRYAKKRVLNAFTAILPADNPQYQLLIMLDEPKTLPETHGFITSGWNTVPTGGNVIARIAPLLGVEPRFDLPPSDRLILATSRTNQ